MAENNAPIRVGLLGAGTVGSQTARLLVEQKDELAQRIVDSRGGTVKAIRLSAADGKVGIELE